MTDFEESFCDFDVTTIKHFAAKELDIFDHK